MKLGFTVSGNENNLCPLSLVCLDKLLNESMVPSNQVNLRKSFYLKTRSFVIKTSGILYPAFKISKKAVYNIHKENEDIRKSSRS